MRGIGGIKIKSINNYQKNKIKSDKKTEIKLRLEEIKSKA